MQEIELKLCIPSHLTAQMPLLLQQASQSNQLTHSPLSLAPHLRDQSTLLQAIYFDTADNRLAQANIALRLRLEGHQWVQTLKMAGTHPLKRHEHNIPLPQLASDQEPKIQPLLHGDTSVGQTLAAILQKPPQASEADLTYGVVEQYRTHIQRQSFYIQRAQASLELSLDQGLISSPQSRRQIPLYELEIEALAGGPQAVIEEARHWVKDYGLWLNTLTKAHRGYLLAHQVAPRPMHAATLTQPVDLASCNDWITQQQLLLLALMHNASALTEPQIRPHVGCFQALRIELRRLRRLWAHLQRQQLLPQLSLPSTSLQQRVQDILSELALQAKAEQVHTTVTRLLQSQEVNLLWLELFQLVSSPPIAP